MAERPHAHVQADIHIRTDAGTLPRLQRKTHLMRNTKPHGMLSSGVLTADRFFDVLITDYNELKQLYDDFEDCESSTHMSPHTPYHSHTHSHRRTHMHLRITHTCTHIHTRIRRPHTPPYTLASRAPSWLLLDSPHLCVVCVTTATLKSRAEAAKDRKELRGLRKGEGHVHTQGGTQACTPVRTPKRARLCEIHTQIIRTRARTINTFLCTHACIIHTIHTHTRTPARTHITRALAHARILVAPPHTVTPALVANTHQEIGNPLHASPLSPHVRACAPTGINAATVETNKLTASKCSTRRIFAFRHTTPRNVMTSGHALLLLRKPDYWTHSFI